MQTGGRTDWAEELTGELENRLIGECYILNPGCGNIYDFEDEFIEEHFEAEKQYIYDLLFEIDKNDLIKILQSER